MPSLWDETRVSVFETLRVVRGRPVALDAHWERLKASQRTVGRPVPSAVHRRMAAAARHLPRWADGMRVELASSALSPAVAVSIVPHRARPARRWQRGITVVTAAGRTAPPGALPAQVKTSERLPGILAWGETDSRRTFEILWCSAEGLLTEGTVSNLFLVLRRQLVTPPVWSGALAGVVRTEILRLARRLRIPAVEVPVTRHEALNAQEAFLTNSLIGIVPIRTMDGRRIGRDCPGPLTRRLQQAYQSIIRKESRGWSPSVGR